MWIHPKHGAAQTPFTLIRQAKVVAMVTESMLSSSNQGWSLCEDGNTFMAGECERTLIPYFSH